MLETKKQTKASQVSKYKHIFLYHFLINEKAKWKTSVKELQKEQ